MRSQHVAFTERNAVLNKIHEALMDVTGHSDQTEILEKVLSPLLLVKNYKDAVRLVSSADAALVIIALAAIDQLHSCSMLLLPSSWSISAKG